MGPLRYGMSGPGTSGRGALLDSARQAEDMGFDTLWVADHVGLFDPFIALVAASAVTSRMRLGTHVLAESRRPRARIGARSRPSVWTP